MDTSWKHLNHALRTTAALVNTSAQMSGVEGLADTEALRNFVIDRIITEVAPPTEADVDPVHRVRARLAATFIAPTDETRYRLVNDALASATVTPRLVEHNELGLHLHYFPPYAPLAEHLNADCAMALAFLVAAGESSRLRVCAAPDCDRVLVDFSRNRSRAYCDSGTCGNRTNAAAFRARQRA